ncbi:rfaE bifunctional protein, domain I [Pelosinus fermentans]|uniref:bifunctional heptose 7-phosphate kinase/heptose 1-phosphate adenyltransferase n=1 Tax=Pelosinus fermentans TaxID=365349 RepID=UPI0002685C13|nr:PfkB family carbohydrate kinase [Pelosinus fermentans]OAM92760.1 PfkB domain protein [Pelosinus fermentans DSM 17108]SDQ56030.1 rfaE bifunctional protein, domain I [Pelosinus fermentans]
MKESLLTIIEKIQKCNIMVIGDIVADVYLEGKISRISREAPVLILEHAEERVVPGGAANVVHNTAALRGKVLAVGVIGTDYAGQELTRILSDKDANTAGLIMDTSRPTITKTRIMAGGQATVRQQIVRIDKEKKEALSLQIEKDVKAYISAHIADMHGVVLSDYGSHTVTTDILHYVIQTCQDKNIPCIVDSRYNIMEYSGIQVVKQNESEAAAAVGYEITDEITLLSAGKTILEHLDAKAVLISRGPDGMTLFEKTGTVTHIPVTNKSEVYDVTGAGDTVVATMILALAAGASYEDAARLSNFAAGIVVKKPGTATTTPEELRQAIGEHFE